jgi:glutamate 5-kinase
VILLSDVTGLLDSKGKRIPLVRDVTLEALPHIHAATNTFGSGGMASKVEAARRATLAGANVVVADARDPAALDDVLGGKDVGTLFVVASERLNAKRYWIAFTLRPRGDMILDAGAARVVRAKGKSVLSVGVLGVRGEFRAGDAVRLLDPEGHEIARGLARCSVADAARVAGRRGEDLPEEVAALTTLVHASELVVGSHT